MKKQNKFIIAAALTAVTVLSTTLAAFAGSWQNDSHGSWYLNDDGSYPAAAWQWIDGNNDGIAESYYFNENGYLLTNATTPDGYTVNADGAWIADGVVQTQSVFVPAADSGISSLAGSYAPRYSTHFGMTSDISSWDGVINVIANSDGSLSCQDSVMNESYILTPLPAGAWGVEQKPDSYYFESSRFNGYFVLENNGFSRFNDEGDVVYYAK